MFTPEDLRIYQGGIGTEEDIPAHFESPTWIVNNAWDQVKEVAQKSLKAYMNYTTTNNIRHSYLLGLDILITAIADPKGEKFIDIRPTILEGPCCNSYPACPNFFALRMYNNLVHRGLDPVEYVDYPTHPTKIMAKIVETFKQIWQAKGHSKPPVVAVFTRSYPESEEETAHILAVDEFKKAGIEAYRITPSERPYVKDGKVWVFDRPIDMVHRRIERVHVPMFYGWELAMDIVNKTPDTIWINPWEVDSLRSKTIEEKCFRLYEEKTKDIVSRPKTLLDKEINPKTIKEHLETGGYALKKWNSSGGKGVFLHYYLPKVKNLFDYLYLKYDGKHMIEVNQNNEKKFLGEFENYIEDAALQQFRIIDARRLSDKERLVYDTRINVIYNELKKEWEFLSGISRTVPTGEHIARGNSILTNITSGANIAPLIFGYTKKDYPKANFGPLLTAMMNGKTELELPKK
jgi:hypothetical protein